MEKESLLPKISCIMPTTFKRKEFLPHAIAVYQRQDYPNKELVIVEEGDGYETLRPLIPNRKDIVYLFVQSSHNAKITLGTQRNIAVSLANGAIIAHQDDDDFYSPHRLTKQVAPLLHGSALLTGMRCGAIYNANEDVAYRISDSLHTQMFHKDIHGGTLVYWKWLWGVTQYANVSVGEDAQFIRNVEKIGTIGKVSNDGDFVYVRHGSNAWSFALGEHIDSEGWTKVGVDGIMPREDLRFYQSLHQI